MWIGHPTGVVESGPVGTRRREALRRGVVGCAVLLAWSCCSPALAEDEVPTELRGVAVQERLGDYVAKDTRFVDEAGRAVSLGDYLGDGRPVLLTLNYYKCETLCTLQLNGLVEGLRSLEWSPGREFKIVTVSIDHREGAELARTKRAAYLESYGRGEVDWSFLTGTAEEISRLADSVGFGYRYDASTDQWAHVAVAMFLAPDGKIVRYIYGLEYRPFDLKMAVQEASDGEIGDPFERIIFSCFHYNPDTGEYAVWAFGVMRLGGLVVLVALSLLLGVLWGREALRKRREREVE